MMTYHRIRWGRRLYFARSLINIGRNFASLLKQKTKGFCQKWEVTFSYVQNWLAFAKVGALHYKPVQKKSNRRPRTAAKSLLKRYEGPWVWRAHREGRCLFSTQRFAPCFLTFVRRVHSQTFEGGLDAPRFLVSEWFIGI